MIAVSLLRECGKSIFSGSISKLSAFSVALSSACTINLRLAFTSKVTSIWGTFLLAGFMPNSNEPRKYCLLFLFADLQTP